jgi:hypothetical protein
MIQRPRFRLEYVAWGILAVMLIGIFVARKVQSPVDVVNVDPAPEEAPSAPESVTPPAQENIVHFAVQIPVGGGMNVISSNGQYNLNAIHVAVRDQFNHIRMLPGTDPEAIKYLAETDAEHKSMMVDNGPMNSSTDSLPPANAASNMRKHLALKDAN